MPRLSTLSNPTGLVEIDKKRIAIVLDEAGKDPAFSLARLDLTGLTIPTTSKLVLVARRGNFEERVELGTAANWDHGFKTLSEIGDDGTWTFRLLMTQQGTSKLVAAAENIRPNGLGDSDSFIALESADLGQRPWEIQIEEFLGKVVIRFNKEIYQSAGEADADKFFIQMILPEAIRRTASWIASNAGALEESQWEDFKAWLAMHDVPIEPDLETVEQQENWCDEVVGAFCDRFQFASQIRDLRKKGSEE